MSNRTDASVEDTNTAAALGDHGMRKTEHPDC